MQVLHQVKQVEITCQDFTCDIVEHPTGDKFIMLIHKIEGTVDAEVGDQVCLKMLCRYGNKDYSITESTSRVIVVTSVLTNQYKSCTVKGLVIKPDNLTGNSADKNYLSMAKKVSTWGAHSGNRTNTNTFKMFGHQIMFDLREGIPVLTSKKVNTGAIIKELLWLLRGETNIKTLGSKIWDQWATEDGDLGPVYGSQWRYWQAFNLIRDQDEKGKNKEQFLRDQGYTHIGNTFDAQKIMFKKVDQIADMMHSLRTNPNDRRMIVTAWNPAHNPDSVNFSPKENAAFGMQALPPCHTIWQLGTTPLTFEERVELYFESVKVEGWNRQLQDKTFGSAPREEQLATMQEAKIPEYYLDLLLYQRSADIFIGVPFNIASYSILLSLIAHTVNMVARNFIHTFGDYHIYENHIEQLKTQFEQGHHALPTLKINAHHEELADYLPEDITLVDYKHGPVLTGEVAE